jgi:hypothetical protein
MPIDSVFSVFSVCFFFFCSPSFLFFSSSPITVRQNNEANRVVTSLQIGSVVFLSWCNLYYLDMEKKRFLCEANEGKKVPKDASEPHEFAEEATRTIREKVRAGIL